MIFHKFSTFRLITKITFSKLQRVYSTIYALSSGRGKCGVAVVRISGKDSRNVFSEMMRMKSLPPARTALLRRIRDPLSGDVIDKGLVLWFPAPNSFTGEDCCELQVHGGAAVVGSILSALGKIKKFQPATPGEFTRRAFYAGKLDLVEVEGLADVLEAETELQLKQALLQSDGILSKLYYKWREQILKNLAHLEAYIDFDETEDLENNVVNEIKISSKQVAQDIEKHLKDGRRGERLRSGVKTVIIGNPNVGKSSLLNLLSQRPAAIVTPIAGTTRDALETTLNINGYPVLLVDTAGLRSTTDDLIEREGMKRTILHASEADLILVVFDSCDILKLLKSNKDISCEELFITLINTHLETSNKEKINLNDKHVLLVLNKTDLLQNNDLKYLEIKLKGFNDSILISCLSNLGTEFLVSKLAQHLELLCGRPSAENPMLSKIRHRHHLENCHTHLLEFCKSVDNERCDMVLAAENLRLAMRQLGKITGIVSTEQLLDVIFKDFCIGK